MHHQLDCLIRRPVYSQFISLCAFPPELGNQAEIVFGISTRYLPFPMVLLPLKSAAFCFKGMMVKQLTAWEENNLEKLGLFSEEMKKKLHIFGFQKIPMEKQRVVMFMSPKRSIPFSF